jgi:hypothetical protein
MELVHGGQPITTYPHVIPMFRLVAVAPPQTAR